MDMVVVCYTIAAAAATCPCFCCCCCSHDDIASLSLAPPIAVVSWMVLGGCYISHSCPLTSVPACIWHAAVSVRICRVFAIAKDIFLMKGILRKPGWSPMTFELLQRAHCTFNAGCWTVEGPGLPPGKVGCSMYPSAQRADSSFAAVLHARRIPS